MTSKPLSFFWFIPTHGDGAYLGSSQGERQPDHHYFRQVAQAADRLGYEGVLLPTGQTCEESWITATGLAAVTDRLKYLVALRPGVTLPTFAARQAAALDRLSNGRLLLNVVVGGNPVELAGDGVFLPHGERYEQAAEFLTIFRRLLSGETVDFAGKHYSVEGGRLDQRAVQQPHPPIYLGGSSDAGQDLAAEQTDTYLTWGEPVAQVAEKIAAVRSKTEARGRTLRFGIRLHFIVRETEEEALARGRPADQQGLRQPDRSGAGALHPADGQRRPAPHVRTAWRRSQQTARRAQPLGWRGPCPQWRGHCPGRHA